MANQWLSQYRKDHGIDLGDEFSVTDKQQVREFFETCYVHLVYHTKDGGRHTTVPKSFALDLKWDCREDFNPEYCSVTECCINHPNFGLIHTTLMNSSVADASQFHVSFKNLFVGFNSIMEYF